MKKQLKHMIIYEWLTDQINNKKFIPGDKIPGEEELAKMFGVHRMTVRQAIDRLVSEHMLVRKRAVGTFLLSNKKPMLVKSLQDISTYHDDIVSIGLSPEYRIIESSIIPASEEVASALNLQIGENVIFVYRVMLASGVPLVIEKSFLPEDMFPGMINFDMKTMIYNIIRENYSMKLVHSRQEIGAVAPSSLESSLLQIDNCCPCLSVESIIYNDLGRPVELSQSVYRGDRYRFNCTIGKYMYTADGAAATI